MSDAREVHPERWAKPVGYAHGMIAAGGGRMVVTAGQIGWNPATQELASDDFAAQTVQALRNVVAVLTAAGARPEHLVRLTWYITDRDEYLAARRKVGEGYREILGKHFPVMTVVVVSGLLEPGAKVEIEATAIVPA
ncbi:MAG: RidA family protein [Gemmatimonadaceae bacterium]